VEVSQNHFNIWCARKGALGCYSWFLPPFLIFSSITMVDIHSVAASSHPSHREREPEREATSRSRAGWSRWAGGHTDATTVVMESQPQRTTGTTTSALVAVSIDTVLLATHQLLNNPPPSKASPLVVEQWHHDVDQLIVAAINTPHQDGRHQPPAQQSRVRSAARAPSMASYMMMDHREEINRRRGREDGHTTIEHHRERHQDIEGHNLEKDFDLHAPVRGGLVTHAPLPPNSLGVSGGCMALAPHLCMVVWPHKF
jgi:hypothetical protein